MASHPLTEVAADFRPNRGRGPRIQVERRDGATLRGEFAGTTADELTVYVPEADAVVAVPLDAVLTLAVAEVETRRYWTYIATAAAVGILVAVGSSRLIPGASWAGLALGGAGALTVLVAGWIVPSLNGWLVLWRRVYAAPDAPDQA